MKYEELCVYKDCEDFQTFDRHFTEAYKKSEVDDAIAELKCELKDVTDDRNEFKKLYSEQIEERCIEKTNVDTLEQALNQMQRTLWLARADRAKAIQWHEGLDRYLQERKAYWPSRFCFMANDEMYHVWYKCWCEVERKCRAKAEEYK